MPNGYNCDAYTGGIYTIRILYTGKDTLPLRPSSSFSKFHARCRLMAFWKVFLSASFCPSSSASMGASIVASES